jgi:dipeptide transport system permease protein
MAAGRGAHFIDAQQPESPMSAESLAAPAQADAPSPWRDFVAAFAENRGAVIGFFVIATIAFVAVFADFIAPYSPIEQFRDSVKLPPAFMSGGDWRYVLGTDPVGRDMLSRLIYGARISLFIGLSVMVVSSALGVVLGLSAAYFGGIIDTVIDRTMDLIVSIPSLVLAILIIAVIGPNLTNTIAAVTVVYLPRYVRLIRASALAELTKDYVTAARVAGAGPFHIMFRTVLPNCLPPLIVQGALGVSDAILEAAGLGFLGLGAQPPQPEWGSMLADSREFIQAAPWIVALPGLAILVTVLAINLMGDGLRDALDPKLKRS